MWNQTATAATSDNNKEKEAVEDCSCAGGNSVASTVSPASVEQQQKSSNIFSGTVNVKQTRRESFIGGVLI